MSEPHTTFRSYVITAVPVWGVFLSITTMVITAVPVNVDESIQYHVVACGFLLPTPRGQPTKGTSEQISSEVV